MGRSAQPAHAPMWQHQVLGEQWSGTGWESSACCHGLHAPARVRSLKPTPNHCHHLAVVLGPEEQAAYRKAHADAYREWDKLRAAGHGTISKHILAAMALLLPMRRICSGGRLPPGALTVRTIEVDASGQVVMAPSGMYAPAEAECCICLDSLEAPLVTPCGHWCVGCLFSSGKGIKLGGSRLSEQGTAGLACAIEVHGAVLDGCCCWLLVVVGLHVLHATKGPLM